jgi:glycosyltransferase 2 family protein
VHRLIRGGVGLALAALVVFAAGPAALLERLQGAKLAWFAAALATAAAANLFSALRWAAISRALGLNARNRDFLVFYFRGVATNSVVPGALLGGDVLRGWQLSRRANPLVESLSSVVVDRLFGLWVQAAISLLAFGATAVSARTPLPGALAAGYFVLLIAILASPALPLGFLAKSRHRLVARSGEILVRWQRFTRERPSGFVRLVAMAALVAFASSTALWLCLQAVDAGVSFSAALGLACGVFVGAALPLALAGFGPREAAAVVFLSALTPGAAAAAASLLYGLAATLQGILAAPLFAVDLGGQRGEGDGVGEARRSPGCNLADSSSSERSPYPRP